MLICLGILFRAACVSYTIHMNFHLLQRCRYLMVGMLSVHYEERDQSYLHTLIVKVRGWGHYRHHAYMTTATHTYACTLGRVTISIYS